MEIKTFLAATNKLKLNNDDTKQILAEEIKN
jgi:hypothetical protein